MIRRLCRDCLLRLRYNQCRGVLRSIMKGAKSWRWVVSATCPTFERESCMPDGVTEIGMLLSELTQLRWDVEPELGKVPDWLPSSSRGSELFRQLTAPEKRQDLVAWSARLRGMPINATAANVIASVERV